MANSNGWFSDETQIYWACVALIEGREINHEHEFMAVKGWRLAAICHRLRTEFGWPIRTEYRLPGNIAHYSLAPGTDPAKLRYPRSAKTLAAQVQEGGHA